MKRWAQWQARRRLRRVMGGMGGCGWVWFGGLGGSQPEGRDAACDASWMCAGVLYGAIKSVTAVVYKERNQLPPLWNQISDEHKHEPYRFLVGWCVCVSLVCDFKGTSNNPYGLEDLFECGDGRGILSALDSALDACSPSRW